MTPRQQRAELMRRWREIEEELLRLTRRRAELDPEDYDRERVALLNTRESLERRLGELYFEQGDPDS